MTDDKLEREVRALLKDRAPDVAPIDSTRASLPFPRRRRGDAGSRP